jgi:AraC family transcriptional regulator
MHWVELGTARSADLAKSMLASSSGVAWNGISLDQVTGRNIGELKEGYFLHHSLILNTSARPKTEVRLASSRWRNVPAAPMTLEFVPAGMPFALRWQTPSDAITVSLTPAFSARVLGSHQLDRAPFQVWSGADAALLSQTVLALAEEARAGFPGGSIYGECLGASLVAELARKSATVLRPVAQPKGFAPKLLRLVLEDIDANLDGDLSLQRLAALAGVSLDGFIRLFKQSTGMPPHQYVLRKRVERAQALLGNPALPLAEIALCAGFANQSHFSRMFHRMTGLAPRQFRRSLK